MNLFSTCRHAHTTLNHTHTHTNIIELAKRENSIQKENIATYLTATQPTKATLLDMHVRPGLKRGKAFQTAIPFISTAFTQNQTFITIAIATAAACVQQGCVNSSC